MKKNNKKESGKQVGIKNYIILALIFIAVIIITLYLCNVYKVYEDSKKQIPVIRGTLSEITSEEFEHYISENPTSIIYICTASSEPCRKYEKDLKKLILREELHEELVYLNIKEDEVEEFTKSFNETYKSRFKLRTTYPALVVFDDGNVTHILQEQAKKKLSITKTKQFLDLHRVEETD